MSAADPSFASGAQAQAPGVASPAVAPSRKRKRSYTSTRSLINLRGSALILDGIILFVPVLAADYALSRVFPHRGFFWTNSEGRTGFSLVSLGWPGVLMTTALAFTYFFVMEATRGQTIGKRFYRLRVQSAAGGPASANAISGRTVLRLIDVLPFLYLLGSLVAILSGRRRRRIGDWVGGTVVVREDDLSPPPPAPPPSPAGLPAGPVVNAFVPVRATPAGRPPIAGGMPPMAGTTQRPAAAPPAPAPTMPPPPVIARPSRWDWRIAAYPLAWIAAVLIATVALGLGKAEGAGEQAIALVHEYVQARDAGDGRRACSLLTPAQQRELVAVASGDYGSAIASRCPRYVLQSEAQTLLNPHLSEAVSIGLNVPYASPTAAVVASPIFPTLQVTAVTEHGTLRLDTLGLERIEFVAGCERGSLLSAEQCGCTFDRLRAEGPVPEGSAQASASWRRRAQEVAEECRGFSGAGTQ